MFVKGPLLQVEIHSELASFQNEVNGTDLGCDPAKVLIFHLSTRSSVRGAPISNVACGFH